jgi:hypothetical protein
MMDFATMIPAGIAINTGVVLFSMAMFRMLKPETPEERLIELKKTERMFRGELKKAIAQKNESAKEYCERQLEAINETIETYYNRHNCK